MGEAVTSDAWGGRAHVLRLEAHNAYCKASK